MSWNPDSGDALSNPAINVLNVEASSMKLWEEFLSGWFNGEQHMLRGAFVDLPLVNKLTFQEMALNPEDGLYLHLTTDQQSRMEMRLYDDERWMVHEYLKVNFWFRSLVKEKRGGHNSSSLVRWGADSLYAILSSKLLVAPLQRKGMSHLRPAPTKLISGGNTAMRQLPLSVCYVYPLEEISSMTAPQIESDVPGATVYIGRDRSFRITPNGMERKDANGNWFAIDIAQVNNEPVLTVEPAE